MNDGGPHGPAGESGHVEMMPEQAAPPNGSRTLPEHPHGGDESSIPGNLPRPRTWLVAVVLIIFIVLLAGLFAAGYVPHEAQSAEASADAAEAASGIPVVNVVHPAEMPVEKDLTLPCDIRPNQQTDLYPQATGYLTKLNVDIQSQVNKGDVLAVIDTPEVDAQLDQSKAALLQAQAAVATAQSNLDLAKITLDRYKNAASENAGSIALSDLDQKKAAYQQAIAALDQANANVTAAQANVQQLTVTQNFEKVVAPFSGTITARNYDVGAYLYSGNIGPGKQLFSMVQSTKLRVFVSVPQVYVTGVKVGQPAYLKVDNYPDRTFDGTVALKADALDASTRTMQFELDFPNEDHLLYPGMYGTAQLAVSDVRPLLGIPSGALVFNADGVQVALVRDGKIHFQKITVGRDMGTELEVRAGLTGVDLVVANPGEMLHEGGAVQVAAHSPAVTDDEQKPAPGITRTAAK